MKKLLIIFLIGLTSYSYSQELTSFEAISASLKEGNGIRLVINFAGCSPKPPIPNLVVYTEATAVMVQPDYLQFANTPLTTNNPAFKDIPILENVTYRISSNNAVNITSKMLSLPDYQIKGNHSSLCKLDSGSVRVYTK